MTKKHIIYCFDESKLWGKIQSFIYRRLGFTVGKIGKVRIWDKNPMTLKMPKTLWKLWEKKWRK